MFIGSSCCLFSLFFFFNDTATTEIYTLSLHDALPISLVAVSPSATWCAAVSRAWAGKGPGVASRAYTRVRSDGPTRIALSTRRGAANVRRAADRTQARRWRAHPRGMVRTRRRLHGRARARLPDVGPADGGLFPRTRAAGARGPYRRDARVGTAPRVRGVGHAAHRQALHGRGRGQGGARARAARCRLRRRRGDDVRPGARAHGRDGRQAGRGPRPPRP